MSRIAAEHLARSAYVYIRQSTADRLVHNRESRRRQYGLADRARRLGWAGVEAIDDDLGRSGGGVSRPGFERMLAAICEGRAGAAFAIEASRLARVHAKHGSAMTAATGTRRSSSVDWSAPSSSTRMESTILGTRTIGCCSA